MKFRRPAADVKIFHGVRTLHFALLVMTWKSRRKQHTLWQPSRFGPFWYWCTEAGSHSYHWQLLSHWHWGWLLSEHCLLVSGLDTWKKATLMTYMQKASPQKNAAALPPREVHLSMSSRGSQRISPYKSCDPEAPTIPQKPIRRKQAGIMKIWI